jgi:ABC-2 type transport system ATP-binding protein
VLAALPDLEESNPKGQDPARPRGALARVGLRSALWTAARDGGGQAVRLPDAASVAAASRRPAPEECAIEVTNLRKRFVQRRRIGEALLRPLSRHYDWALDDVSFVVEEGECFGLLGPNGAGKTTLFKILSTLILPYSGRISVGGWDVVADPARVRTLLSPVIPDDRSLQWRLSGIENLRLYAAIHRMPRGERERRVRAVLDLVGLADAGHKMVAQYSSGMKQRLLIARALLPRPRVLLLDEPTRSLDPLATRRFWAFVRDELIGAQGCTVLLATHDPEEALSLCDRIGIMNRGKMLSVGPPRSLLAESVTGRYRVWTNEPDHPGFRALGARIVSASPGAIEGGEGWTEVELEIPEGPEFASRVNTALVLQGVPIAHFERVQKTLSEYIVDVVEARGASQ